MKPRTLARFALKRIEDGTFIFDCPERRIEAIRQMKSIISGKCTGTNNPQDPIVEIHIGVYIPNFDYPIVPVDSNGDVIVWKEDYKYEIPGKGTHTLKGVSVSGEHYYLLYMDSLAPFRQSIIKVDKYTDLTRAAYALVCAMSSVIKKPDHVNTPLKMEYDELLEQWKTHEDIKQFEKEQHKLYIKWLTEWLSMHGRNPDTHMRVLRPFKKIKEPT